MPGYPWQASNSPYDSVPLEAFLHCAVMQADSALGTEHLYLQDDKEATLAPLWGMHAGVIIRQYACQSAQSIQVCVLRGAGS